MVINPFIVDLQQAIFLKVRNPVVQSYFPTMDTAVKKRLAHEGKSDIISAAIRAKAARLYAGVSQEQLAQIIGRGKTNINNMERARSFPSWSVMTYFYDEHRIDVNFIVLGVYSQLPSDVQIGLFAQLSEIDKTTDLTPSSDRNQADPE